MEVKDVSSSFNTKISSNLTNNIIHLTNENLINELLNSVDYILTDCDGVIYLNDQIISNTPQVFTKFRQAGKHILFVSNNSTKSRIQVKSKLTNMGFHVELNEIFVSSYVAAEYFKSKGFKDKIYVFGGQGIKDELDQLAIQNFGVGPDTTPISSNNLVPPIELEDSVEGVIVGYDNLISLPKVVKTCTYAQRVKPEFFVATNTDETFPTPNPNILVPGTGAFVNFVKTAVGIEPVTMGKPNTCYWDAIKRIHPNIDGARTLMIGDRLNTDIAFGNLNGIKYTLLVGTGVHTIQDAADAIKDKKYNLVPSHFANSLGDLNKYL